MVKKRIQLNGTVTTFPSLSRASAIEYLRRHPVVQIDSLSGRESWFRLDDLHALVCLVARSETIHEGDWRGSGWYRTELTRDYTQHWLRLVKADIASVFARRHDFMKDDLEKLHGPQ